MFLSVLSILTSLAPAFSPKAGLPLQCSGIERVLFYIAANTECFYLQTCPMLGGGSSQ